MTHKITFAFVGLKQCLLLSHYSNSKLHCSTQKLWHHQHSISTLEEFSESATSLEAIFALELLTLCMQHGAFPCRKDCWGVRNMLFARRDLEGWTTEIAGSRKVLVSITTSSLHFSEHHTCFLWQMQSVNVWPAFTNLVNLYWQKISGRKFQTTMVASTFYCSIAAPRCNLYAEVLGLIQHFTAFVFHHLFSERETEIAVEVESQRGCTVCCLQVWET